MAKTKISEFSSTPASNTDIDSINIAEGCAPSGINDAIRELMAQLKDFQTGAVGDSFNGPVGTTTAAAGAFTTLSASSTVSGTGFSTYLASPPAIGGTAAAAVSATTLTTSSTVTLNGGTANGVAYLNGSKVVTSGSALVFDGTNFGVGTSNPAAFGLFALNGASASANINASTGSAALKFYEGSGTGRGSITSLNGSDGLAFLQGTTEGMRLTSTGLGIGTSSPAAKLDVSQSQNGQTAVQLTNSNAGASTEATFIANNGTYIGSFGVAGASKSAFGAILASDAYIFSNANVANTGITLMANSANGVIKFATGGSTEKMRLDSSGNLGLGVTPSATSGGKSLEIGYVGSSVMSTAAGQMNMTSNVYYNAGWKYAGTGTALLYQQSGTGIHAWYNATSGTAGNAISWTQAATLTANGNYLVGTTTENSGSGGLKVAGQFAVSSSQAFTSSGTINSTAFYVVCYSLSGTCTLTLPTPSTNVGRVLKIVTQSDQAIVSASSNVTAIASGGLTTSILPATAGKWAELWCDGSYWAIIGTNA